MTQNLELKKLCDSEIIRHRAFSKIQPVTRDPDDGEADFGLDEELRRCFTTWQRKLDLESWFWKYRTPNLARTLAGFQNGEISAPAFWRAVLPKPTF